MSFLKTDWIISNKLYFGSFAVRKRIISATFKHPILKKDVCHKFHIGELEYHPSQKEFTKHLESFKNSTYLPKICKTDLTNELNTFVQKPSKDFIYFFFEVYDGAKMLPLHYAIFYTRDCFDDPVPPNAKESPLWAQYIHECENELSEFVYSEKIHPSYFYDLYKFFHDFGFEVFEWLNIDSPEYIDEPFLIESIESYQRRFNKFRDVALRNYTLAVLKSVINQSLKNNDFIICDYCGRFIDYHKGKKYCSLLSENRDCAKKARNKRYYEQTGHKNLDKYRRKTKELRTFYKDHSVKK